MHRLPPWIWLLLAGIFGISASLAWVKSQARPAPIVEKAALVPVARKDIPPATRLSVDQLQLAPWSRAHLPKGAFTSLGDLEGRVGPIRWWKENRSWRRNWPPRGHFPDSPPCCRPPSEP
jgi:hypothetical protein